MVETPSFFTRLKLAFWILGNPVFASKVLAIPASKPDDEPVAELPPKVVEAPAPKVAPGPTYDEGALVLLSLLQREGRFVDFVEQDIATASDEDVASAARVVHEGCRAALRRHVPLVPLWDEDEGATSEVAAGYDPNAVKLTGNVAGKGPWKGTVRHRGWRAKEPTLPRPTTGHDATAIAPAEVEIT